MDLQDLSLLLLYLLKRNCYFTAHVLAVLVRSELSAKVSPVAFYQHVTGLIPKETQTQSVGSVL